MISTTIRTAAPRNWESHNVCDRAEAVKGYTRRRAKADEAAAETEAETAAVRAPPRVCADCQTSETPLWRSGPDGPKSLCNACGIKYRKRRRGLATAPHGKLTAHVSKGEDGEVLSSEELKRRQKEKQLGMLKLLVLQHQQQRRSKREEEEEEEEKAAMEAGKEVEEAALLLLSLSSGLFVHS